MHSFRYGRVDEDGNDVNSGSGGWNSERVGSYSGRYKVTFTGSLVSDPVVLVSCDKDANNSITTFDISCAGFTVETWQDNGGREDAGFNFVAIC